MKILTLLLVCSLMLSAFSLRADDDTPLEKQMQIMARSMKQLSLQVVDSTKQQESITLLETLKKAASDSQQLEPRKTSSIPQAEQEKFMTAYKAQMDKLSEAFNQIEEALKAGKYDQAKALLATVGSIKKEGHSKFKQD